MRNIFTKTNYRFWVWQRMGGDSDGALVPGPRQGLQVPQQSVADVVLGQRSGVQGDGVVGGCELANEKSVFRVLANERVVLPAQDPPQTH